MGQGCLAHGRCPHHAARMCWSNSMHATSCVHVNSEGCVTKADFDCGTVLLMVALEDHFIGRTPVVLICSGTPWRHAHRAVLQQEINGLACLSHDPWWSCPAD